MAKQDVTVELFYSGTWNEVPDAVYVRNPVTITVGDADEAGQPPPASARLTLAGHTYFPGNVTSPLYGLIGRYTPIRITVDTDQRFIGEVASWTPRMSTDLNDTWVLVKAFGISHRLEQGTDPLRDAIDRFVIANDPVRYWPLNDVEGSTQARAATGGTAMRATEPILSAQFGKGFLAPWLPPGLLTGQTDDGALDAPVSGAASGGWSLDYLFRAPDPAGWGDLEPQFAFARVVDEAGWTFRALVATDFNDLEIQVIDPSGTPVGGGAVDLGNLLDGQPHHIRFRAVNTFGTDTSLSINVDGQTVLTAAHDVGVSTPPAVSKVGLGWFLFDPWTLPVHIGKLALWDLNAPDIADTHAAYTGHTGEPAGERIERVADEEGVAFTSTGDLEDTQPLGPQYPDGFMAILREAANTDLGILHDSRATAALHYITGRALYSQLAVMVPNFVAGQVAPSLDPTLDDQATRNDVTVTNRVTGATAQAVDAASVAAIGRVNTGLPGPLNLAADGFLEAQAAWRLRLGTNADLRVPALAIDLVAAPTLFGAVEDIQPGSRVVQLGLPDTINADTVHLLVRGWAETIGSHTRKVTFLCVPESSLHVSEVAHIFYGMLLSDSAVTAEALDTTETGVDINAGAGPDWVYEDDIEILIGGERMTVTAVAAMAGTFPNRTTTLTVTRSVNGIVKSHATGAPITFLNPHYIGL